MNLNLSRSKNFSYICWKTITSSKIKRTLLFFILFSTCGLAFSQNNDTTKVTRHFSGIITATNNGVSLIPSFSLGKPAFMFDFSIGGEKLSFDPMFRVSMKGKPWAFIFWWRYKLVNQEKFSLRIGAHPSLIFSTDTYPSNGTTVDVIKASRFVAAEIAPSFYLSKNITFMPYYLTGHGFDPGIRNSHYFAAITNFSNLRLTNQLIASVTPQLFFLNTDNDTGIYFTSSFTLKHNTIPIGMTGMFNQKLNGTIPGKDFIWSLGLYYSFANYFEKK